MRGDVMRTRYKHCQASLQVYALRQLRGVSAGAQSALRSCDQGLEPAVSGQNCTAAGHIGRGRAVRLPQARRRVGRRLKRSRSRVTLEAIA